MASPDDYNYYTEVQFAVIITALNVVRCDSSRLPHNKATETCQSSRRLPWSKLEASINLLRSHRIKNEVDHTERTFRRDYSSTSTKVIPSLEPMKDFEVLADEVHIRVDVGRNECLN